MGLRVGFRVQVKGLRTEVWGWSVRGLRIKVCVYRVWVYMAADSARFTRVSSPGNSCENVSADDRNDPTGCVNASVVGMMSPA